MHKSLNEHYADQDEAEAYELELKSEIDRLTERGNEYYPFSLDNFTEALREMGIVNIVNLLSVCHLIHRGEYTNEAQMALMGIEELNEYAIKYWRDAAVAQAERNLRK